MNFPHGASGELLVGRPHGLWDLVVFTVVVFECGGWDVAAALVEPVVVVPVDPFVTGCHSLPPQVGADRQVSERRTRLNCLAPRTPPEQSNHVWRVLSVRQTRFG